MPDVDFLFTFPSYFWLTDSGNLQIIESEGDSCICLFTARNLVDDVHREKYGNTNAVGVLAAPDCQALLDFVNSIEAECREQGVQHIAIDVTPGKMIGRATFSEVVGQLEKQRDMS